MHARLHMASILLKIFLPHSNRLKYHGSLTTGLSITIGSSCSVSSIAYFLRLCFLTLYDSRSYVDFSWTTPLSDSPPSSEQTWGTFQSARNNFDQIQSVEQTCEIGICCVPVISVFTVSMSELRASALIVHLAKVYYQVKVAASGFMWAPLPHMTFITQFLKLHENL